MSDRQGCKLDQGPTSASVLLWAVAEVVVGLAADVVEAVAVVVDGEEDVVGEETTEDTDFTKT